MGMNTILMLIAGIVMSTMIASQVAPSIVEGVKVKKVQTETINNQEVIFEAIKRYITIQQEAPKDMDDLFKFNYIDSKVNDNGFNGGYEISVSPTTGVVTIITTIDDPKAQEIFLKSFKGISKPSCKVDEDGICVPNKFETKYVIPNNIMHGNALLMTGIPIGSTPPDHNTNKYWYDTSTGEAILKVYDKDILDWVEVNLGGSGGDDSTNVKLIGDQTIDGIKTFTSSPKAPTPATSDNSTNLATTQFVKNLINSEGFTQSLTPNGWVKFPNGLIIQWGINRNYDAAYSLSSYTINFPIAFPNDCFLVNGNTQTSYTGAAAAVYFAISSWNKTSFTRPGYIGRFSWIAIGY